MVAAPGSPVGINVRGVPGVGNTTHSRSVAALARPTVTTNRAVAGGGHSRATTDLV
jgi:broad-specificity NMP kinase